MAVFVSRNESSDRLLGALEVSMGMVGAFNIRDFQGQGGGDDRPFSQD